MSKPSDLLFTGAWMKDADEQLRATFDLGFAAGLEAAAKVMDEEAMAALDASRHARDASNAHQSLRREARRFEDLASAIRALPAAQRGDDTK